jgi:peptidoglycan/LPS O-acetylase OafA/YrhL
LVHFPIMVALATIGAGMLHLPLFGYWPLSAASLMVITFLTSVGLAYLSYHWVELPGIKLGNLLLSAWLRSPPVEHRQIASNVSAD